MSSRLTGRVGLVTGIVAGLAGGAGIVALVLGNPACNAVPPCAVNGLCVPDMTAYDIGVDLSAIPRSFTLLSPSIAGATTASFLGIGDFGAETDVILAVPQTTDLGAGTALARYSAKSMSVAGLYPLRDRAGSPLTVSLMASIVSGSGGLGADLALAYSKAGSDFFNVCAYTDYSTGNCGGIPLPTAPVTAIAAAQNDSLVVLGTGSAVVVYDAALYATTYSLGAVRALAVADLNGDGKPDVAAVVVPSGGDGGSASGLTVLINQGDSGVGWNMAPATVACTGCVEGVKESLQLADVDGKNGPDLVLADLTTLHVLLNQGNGQFGAQMDQDLDEKIVEEGGAVAVGAVAGDADPDLVILRPSTQRIELYSGQGNGTFSGMVTYAADANSHLLTLGPTPYGVAQADFNGDGKPDIATSSGVGLQVLLGQ